MLPLPAVSFPGNTMSPARRDNVIASMGGLWYYSYENVKDKPLYKVLLRYTMEYTTTLAEHQPIAITIGNFDGIHKGHQCLMHELRDMAQKLNCTPTLVTFSPHTLMVVRPDIYVEYLTTLEEKLALTKQYGAVSDSIVIH